MHTENGSKPCLLWTLLSISWYITVFSAFPLTYLFRIELPIGGYLYLYRALLPFVMILFLIWITRNRINPFSGLNKIERRFMILVFIMILYGIISVFFSLNYSIWFSKFLAMGYDFCFTFLFLYMTRDKTVRHITLLIIIITMSGCALGSLAEIFVGTFFDTPYAKLHLYYFFGNGFFMPFFTFYNTNTLAVSLNWILIIGLMYLFELWDSLHLKHQNILFCTASLAMMLCNFLCHAGSARLAIISWTIIFIGFIIWLILRYKRGLWSAALVLCFCLFVYIGENYAGLKDSTISFVSPPTQILTEADSVRVQLLKDGANMLIHSKGLGVGFGNSTPILYQYDNLRSTTLIHCFFMEIFAEFGLFSIIPFLFLLISLLQSWYTKLHIAIQKKDWNSYSNIIFQICAAITFPLLSTANSTAWGIPSMWMYLAYLMQDNSELSDVEQAYPISERSSTE